VSSVREQILTAVMAALNDAGRPVGVPAAERTRVLALEVAGLPSTVLVPRRESVQFKGGRWSPLVERTLTIELEHRAAGGSGVTSEQAADALLSWPVKALCGNTLGGLAMEIRESGTEWQYADGEEPFVLASQSFEIAYTTRVADADQRV
jgi:hypothetical protein